MAFEMQLTPETSVDEIRSLSNGDLEEHLSALLTCSIELSLDGVSLLHSIPKPVPPSKKLDTRGLHGILCLEFLADLLTATRKLGESSDEETVPLISSLYSLRIDRTDGTVRITLEDGEIRSYRLGQFPFKEFRHAAVVAAKSLLNALAEANPLTKRVPQVSKIAEMVAHLVG